MRVSVIIPAFNEAACIDNCLNSLVRQDISKDNFEVVVIDNGSTDLTRMIASTFQSKLSVVVKDIRRSYVSVARNEGAKIAKGKLLAFMDADCVAPAAWLSNALQINRDGIFGAHYDIPTECSWVGRIWSKYQAVSKNGATLFVPGGCMFVSSSTFQTIGGFDENIETSEDVEICSRVKAVFAYPELAVVHEGTPGTLIHFYRQNRWHGKDVARNFFSSLPKLKNAGVVALSIYMLILFWLTAISAVGLLLGYIPMIVVGGGLLLLILPSILLSLKKTMSMDFVPLFILYLVYSLSRAASVAGVLSRK